MTGVRMGLGSVVWSLLLGVALSASCASAAEIATQANRAGSSALSQPNSTAVSGKQKLRRAKTNGTEAKDSANGKGMVPAGSTAERKGGADAEGSASQSNPAVDPPHLALRGVRG